MKNTFTLHSKLKEDSHFVADLKLSQLRLMNNQNYSWLLLIPRVDNITELYQLTAAEQADLLQEINHISHVLKTHFPCDKLNIAMLGNQVPQLHVHIIARRINDPAWPNPVWGQAAKPYTTEVLKERLETIKKQCQ